MKTFLAGILLSASALASALASPPGIVGQPATPSAGVNDYALLTWSAPIQNLDGTMTTDIVSYKIYKGTLPSNMVLYATLKAPASQFKDPLTVGVGADYSVTAVNSKGEESPQAPAMFKVVIVVGGTNSFLVQ